jgi:hypothetical protein
MHSFEDLKIKCIKIIIIIFLLKSDDLLSKLVAKSESLTMVLILMVQLIRDVVVVHFADGSAKGHGSLSVHFLLRLHHLDLLRHDLLVGGIFLSLFLSSFFTGGKSGISDFLASLEVDKVSSSSIGTEPALVLENLEFFSVEGIDLSCGRLPDLVLDRKRDQVVIQNFCLFKHRCFFSVSLNQEIIWQLRVAEVNLPKKVFGPDKRKFNPLPEVRVTLVDGIIIEPNGFKNLGRDPRRTQEVAVSGLNVLSRNNKVLERDLASFLLRLRSLPSLCPCGLVVFDRIDQCQEFVGCFFHLKDTLSLTLTYKN